MSLTITSYFSKNGTPKLGLSPSIRIWRVTSIGETLVIGSPDGLLAEIGDGFYKYIFTVANGYVETDEYVIRSDAEDNTLSDSERFAVASISEDTLSDSTINTVVDGVWEEQATDHIDTGTTGLMLNQIKADTASIKIDTTSIIALCETLLKYDRNRTQIDKTAMTLTIYDDNGTTPLTVFDLKDAGGNPTITEICIRDPQ